MLRETQVALLEVTETHGATTFVSYDMIPEALRERLVAAAEHKGWNEERLRAEWNGTNIAHPDHLEKADFVHGGVLDDMIHIAIEDYHKERDEAILLSENIVGAYNAMASAHLDELTDKYNKIDQYLENARNTKVRAGIYDTKELLQRNNNLLVFERMCSSIKTFAERFAEYTGENAEYRSDWDNLASELILSVGYGTKETDPKKVHRMIQSRIDYCDMICAALRAMLSMNHELLGYTEAEALVLMRGLESNDDQVRALSVKNIKDALKDNEKSFKTSYGYDFSKLGAGKFYVTKGKTGFEHTETIDRIIQHCIEYDTVVSCHGSYKYKDANTTNREMRRIKHKTEIDLLDSKRKVKDYFDAFEHGAYELNSALEYLHISNNDMIDGLESAIKRVESKGEPSDSDKKILDMQKKALRNYQNQNKSLDKFFEKELDPIDNPYCSWQIIKYVVDFDKHYPDNDLTDSDKKNAHKLWTDYQKYKDEIANQPKITNSGARAGNELIRRANRDMVWTCQPISTEHGTFTDVNELLQSLIDHGSKNIYLSMCNPGHMNLDPKFKKIKGVKVHYARNSLIVEDAMDVDLYASAESYLNEAAEMLGEAWYFAQSTDDEFDVPVLDEGSLLEAITVATLWGHVKTAVKKAIDFLRKLFARFIEIVRNMIKSIKEWFERHKNVSSDKTRDSVELNQIIIEDANTTKSAVNTLTEIERQSSRACESIAKKLAEIEKQQLSAMEELEKFIESQEKTTNESVSAEMESLMGLIM